MAFWIAEAFFRRAYDLKDSVHRIASNDRTRPRRHLLSNTTGLAFSRFACVGSSRRQSTTSPSPNVSSNIRITTSPIDARGLADVAQAVD